MRRSWLHATAVVALLVVAWAATWAAGGSRSSAPHLFYLPVVLAALWSSPKVAVTLAAVAGVVAGPLMPLDVATGADQSLGNWLVRATVFVAVSLAASMVASRQRQVAERLRDVARGLREVADERDGLVRDRDAVLQIVSHEIRTPVAVLKGGSELIASGRAGERVPDLARAMGNAVARLEDLTLVVTAAEGDDTLDHLPRLAVPVDLLVGRAVAALGARHDPARIRVDGPGDAVVVLTAPDYVKLALKLVLDNGLRFSEGPVALAATVADGRLSVTVEDHGPGIPGDVWASPVPFTQGDASMTRRHGGLGMGLYTARRLIHTTGGEVRLAPAVPHGARVTLEVPAAPASGSEPRWS